MQVMSQRVRVLITVKASPQPSAKYGDTVCVAGIRVDGGRADWIRLYPLAFRWMGVEQQFKKFDLIDVEVRRESKDSRPESYRPDIDSIKIVRHLDDWKDRQPFMERVARTSTCALSAAAAEHHDAPSLGMVTVKSVERLRSSRSVSGVTLRRRALRPPPISHRCRCSETRRRHPQS